MAAPLTTRHHRLLDIYQQDWIQGNVVPSVRPASSHFAPRTVNLGLDNNDTKQCAQYLLSLT